MRPCFIGFAPKAYSHPNTAEPKEIAKAADGEKHLLGLRVGTQDGVGLRRCPAELSQCRPVGATLPPSYRHIRLL
jgi:hypothetical protein